MTREELVQELLELPSQIRTKSGELLGLNDNALNQKSDISRYEATIRNKISDETNDAGKPVFSNAEKRNAEFTKRAANDSELIMLNESYKSMERIVDVTKLEIQELRDRQSNLRIILATVGSSQEDSLLLS